MHRHTYVSKASVYKLDYQRLIQQKISVHLQEHKPEIIKKVVLNSQTCAMSEFKAVLAAVYIAVKLKQAVSSDMDKNKQKVLKSTDWKTYL